MARNPIVVDGGGPALTPEQIKSQAATVSAAAQKASIDKKVKSIGGSKEAQELVRQILTEQANADAAWAAAGGTEGIIQGLSGLGTVGGAAKSPVAASGGLTKADIDAAVATANAANATVIKQLQTQLSQIQAQQQSEKIASRVKAKDKLTAMLAGWNLQGLATYVDKQITDDVSEETSSVRQG